MSEQSLGGGEPGDGGTVLQLVSACIQCGCSATVVTIEVSGVQAEIDLCEEHLDQLLRGARPVPGRTAS
jgi:hypothetical protein